MPNNKKRVPQITGGAQPDASLCCICVNKAEQKDVAGYYWCEEHAHKAWVINWLGAHDWIMLYSAPYAIAGDQQNAVLQVIQGSDQYIWHIMRYIDYLETEWQKGRAS